MSSGRIAENIGEGLQDLAEKAYIPGISMTSIVNGNIVGSRAAGISDNESKTPVTTDTVFWACSLSKPVFSYLVFKLMEHKIVDFNLDTPLWEKFDDTNYFGNHEGRKKITARMILSHQTGLPNEGPIDSEFNPGNTFRYSGEGYLYLQRVIEKQTGMSLEELAQKEIFNPLKMKKSSFLLPEPETIAATHDEFMVPKLPLPKIPANNNNAAGSLHTTASDYALFIEAILKDEKFIKEAFKPQVFKNEAPTMEEDKEALRKIGKEKLKPMNWGLGFGLQQSDKKGEENIAFHWGHGPGARAFVAINVNNRSATAYFANSENGLAIAQDVSKPIVGNIQPSIDYLFGKYGYKDYAALEQQHSQEKSKDVQPNKRIQWLQELAERKRNPIKLEKEKLQECVGQYGPLSVSFKEDSLHLVLFGQHHELIPISENIFASKNDITFRIEFDKEKRQVTSHFLDPKQKPITEDKAQVASKIEEMKSVPSTTLLIAKRMQIKPIINTVSASSEPTLMQSFIQENRLMPRTESWWEDELAQKKEILKSFWNERVLNLNQNSLDGFKRYVINVQFPKSQAFEEKIEKLFSDAALSKIDFDNFFAELKHMPLIHIRGMGLFEKLISETPPETKEHKANIETSDLMNIKRYMAEKGVSASIAIGTSEGKLINPNFSDSQSSAFAMHSVGKVFTGMLAMMMIRDGTISENDLHKPIQLDESVTKALPPAIREQLAKVTLHQVMTHKAGLSDYLGKYCQAISEEKIPEMKQPEDFLQFCEDSYYLKATTKVPEERETRPYGYFLVKEKDDWSLLYINDRNEKMQIKIDEIDGLAEALKALPAKLTTELSSDDLKNVHFMLNKHYCDNQIDKPRYSNAGILLAGLAIKHAYEKKHGSCNYDDILQEYIIKDAGMTSFSSLRPNNAKVNKDDHDAPHIAGSPAGGYWTTAEDLAKFGQWIHKKCSSDPKLVELMENYGQEFYNKETRFVSHSGGIPSSSAFLSVSLNTGQTLATLSDQPAMATELHHMVQDKFFHKQSQTIETDDLHTSPGRRI